MTVEVERRYIIMVSLAGDFECTHNVIILYGKRAFIIYINNNKNNVGNGITKDQREWNIVSSYVISERIGTSLYLDKKMLSRITILYFTVNLGDGDHSNGSRQTMIKNEKKKRLFLILYQSSYNSRNNNR